MPGSGITATGAPARRSPLTPAETARALKPLSHDPEPFFVDRRRHADPATWSARRRRRAHAWRDCGDHGVAVSGLPVSQTREPHNSAPVARLRSSVGRRSTCVAWSTPKRDVTKSRSLDNAQPRFLKCQFSLPVSTMSQWWVRRSSSAVVIARPFAEGEIGGDQDRGALVEPADEVKKLAAGPTRTAGSRARRGRRSPCHVLEAPCVTG